MTTPFDFLRSRTIWYFALIFAIYLFTGCNNFWTPCTETPDEAFCQESANTDGGDKIDQTTNTTSPIGRTRKFEEKAFIKVDNTFKFVGMKGTTPVFLRHEGALKSSWVAYQLDLLKEKEEERSTLDMNRIGFPMAPDHDFLNAPILVSGSTFYMLPIELVGTSTPKEQKRNVYWFDPKTEIRPGVQRTDTVQYFRHPQQNVLAVTVKPSMTAQSATMLRWLSGGTAYLESGNAPATELVMGDLDATDPAGDGTEVIWFEGSQIQEVRHQGVGGGSTYPDPYLKVGLQEAMDRKEKGSLIQGGFVANLNDDRFTDFVYARGSKLYVTSYIGRSASGLGLFADWPDDKMPSFSIEKVKSIQAVDLTKEGYPELVVETDQAVHFYLSIP